MYFNARGFFALAVLGFAAFATPVRAQLSYQITDLGTLGGTSSFALDINNKRQVTGNSQTASGNPAPRLNAYVYNGGALANIGVLPGSNNFSRGYAINDNGVIVGESDNNTSQAFRYENGVMTNLGALGGTSAVAHDINNAGTIVGIASNGTSSKPFIRDTNGMRDLGTLSGNVNSSGRAWAINQNGDVAGFSRYDDVNLKSHATFWAGGVSGSALDLGALVNPSNFSQAYALNNNRQIVGSSVVGTVSPTSSTDLYHAFFYQNNIMSDMGILSQFPTYIHSEAKDINASGIAVGYVARLYNAPGSGGAAFVWQNGTMYDLNSLLVNSAGWNLLDAEGINDLGDIVGYGTIGGQSHAFLLTSVTPVPEPGTIALIVGLCVPGAAFVKRRRKK